MIIKIMGKEFPLAYTVEARKKIEERFGGALTKEKLEEILDTTDKTKYQENIFFLAKTMITAAKQREAVLKKMMGEEPEPIEDIDFSGLEDIMEPGEIETIGVATLKAISEGNKVRVEVLPEDKKKEETKQDKT